MFTKNELIKVKRYVNELELRRRKEKELTEEKLESIIESYRASRSKELKFQELSDNE